MLAKSAGNAMNAAKTEGNGKRGQRGQSVNAPSAPVPRPLACSGDEGARTLNPCLAKAVLSQLSYVPRGKGGRGIERNRGRGGLIGVYAPSAPCSLSPVPFSFPIGRHKIRTCDLVVISDAL